MCRGVPLVVLIIDGNRFTCREHVRGTYYMEWEGVLTGSHPYVLGKIAEVAAEKARALGHGACMSCEVYTGQAGREWRWWGMSAEEAGQAARAHRSPDAVLAPGVGDA